MEALFLKLLNMSITASYLVLAVLILRQVLKKAPRAMHCALWALVAIRLICPLTIESALSLLPSAEPVPQDIFYDRVPAVHTGVTPVDDSINSVLVQTMTANEMTSVNPIQIVAFAASWIWILGMVITGIYGLVSYLRIRRRVAPSVQKDGVWVCDYIDSPFILGILRPRIYLPSMLPTEDQGAVVAHERAHMARRDHWWKPLGYLLLTVYWFNPLLWVAYVLLCKDIELACDERVIRNMEPSDRAAYSRALLGCSVKGSAVVACPLAFGEVGVKERVKTVLSYKKPAFWIVLAAVIAVVVAGVCFLTDPAREPEVPEENVNVSFDATVLQVQESNVLVAPVEGSAEQSSATQIWVSLDVISSDPVPEMMEGDVIRIVYNGQIAETYPAQINTVFAIYSGVRSLEHLKQDAPTYFFGDSDGLVLNNGQLLALIRTSQSEVRIRTWMENNTPVFGIVLYDVVAASGGSEDWESMPPVNAAEMRSILSYNDISAEKVTLENQTEVYTDDALLAMLVGTDAEEDPQMVVAGMLSEQVNATVLLNHVPGDSDTLPSERITCVSNVILDDSHTGALGGDKVYTVTVSAVVLCQDYRCRDGDLTLMDTVFSPVRLTYSVYPDGDGYRFECCDYRLGEEAHWAQWFPAEVLDQVENYRTYYDQLNKQIRTQLANTPVPAQ